MITTAHTNQCLSAAGIATCLDDDTLKTVLSNTSPALFADALRKAVNDPGARVWLTKVLNLESDDTSASPARLQKPTEPIRNETDSRTVTHERTLRGHHVYGSKAAMYLALDETRAGIHTLRLEGAMARGVRDYDWQNKISIQLTQQELPHVAAVLFGWVQGCEYKNHGPAKNKGFKLTLQEKRNETGLFVNISEANKPLCAIPVSAVDLFYLRNLAMEQIAKQSPTLDSQSLLSSLKTYAGMLGT